MGGSSPFQNYIQFPEQTKAQLKLVQSGLLARQPGALNQGQGLASLLNNYFTFFAYLTPILGAIMADQYVI